MGSAAENWRQLVGQRRGGERFASGGPPPESRMAERLRESPDRDMTVTPVYRAVMAGLGAERTVLDIGAGPGRYTLPLARAGCRVWALEPAEGMRHTLASDLAAHGAEVAGRVAVIDAAWPQGRDLVPRVEVAVASLVVHFYPDGAAFLAAMDAAASRRCVLAIRAGQMQPLAEQLWPDFHPARPFPRQPVLADLLPLLAEVGIEPQVELHAAARSYGRYRDREEAGRQLAGFLHLEDAADLERLDARLQSLLRPAPEGDGWLQADLPPVQEALVTWAPGA